MLRSMHAVALALPALGACAQTSQPPPTTTAPVVSASVSTSTSTSAAVAPVAPEPAPATAPTGVGDQFRACQSDADCVAVPRAGCCDNGWKDAIAASQTDAYAQANACTRQRPICPMFKVRDRRVAYCEAQTHLCSMKQP